MSLDLWSDDDPFADTVRADLAAMKDSQRELFDALLGFAVTATGAKPSAKWLKAAQLHVSAIGKDTLGDAFGRWFPQVRELMNDHTTDALKGFVWIASLLEGPEVASAVGNLASACFKKIPNHGALSSKVGNACLWTLGALSATSIHGVAQLGRLKMRVRYAQALRLVDKALADAAARAGLSSEELLELGVPTCGLDPDGVSEEELGDYRARVEVSPRGEVSLSWLRADGKAQASIPAEVKRDHAEDLKAVKARVKDIESLLPAQSMRLEAMMLEPRDIPMAAFRERYLDHGLVARSARRLIWSLGTDAEDAWTSAIYQDGHLVDVHGTPVPMEKITRARLWHPLGKRPADVLAWRQLIARQEITQPFKQAHREIYVLTDAELATGAYSNRFAAHVLKQHQFAALLRERGWRYTLMGKWDSANTPERVLPHFGLTVEYLVEAAWETEATSDAGIFLHVLTDQVRFLNLEGPVPLTEVPALVFSELLRDVDLFVGVCSVGNDPTWEDGGPQAGHAYWREFAFGELGASAQTRKSVLETLLPKLKIKDRTHLEGRYLVVRGDLRTYKIHLGSGNILMEPNDQYLCIVPERGARSAATSGLVLPFEGDSGLSVILSKALLLAADTKIKDETILRQIKT